MLHLPLSITWYVTDCVETADTDYCFLEALKSMLIIPRTPDPIPLEERDPDTMTLEELRECHRRRQAQRVRVRARWNDLEICSI